jgi:hypothetical protein
MLNVDTFFGPLVNATAPNPKELLSRPISVRIVSTSPVIRVGRHFDMFAPRNANPPDEVIDQKLRDAETPG